MSKNKIVYISNDNLIRECDRIPVVRNRASMVHSLIESFNLLKSMQVKSSRLATDDELRLFHSESYIEFIKKQNTGSLKDENGSDDSSDDEEVSEEQLEFGLGYDCPKLPRMYDFVKTIAGGTLTAVDSILEGSEIVINWCGGWHHGQRDEAEGFCYVNDIAIGIQKLREKFKRVLYIDLDVHHGNGVENAFCFTKRVFTLSFHLREDGFFPGTGLVDDCGLGPGRGYAANFPYKSGISGKSFVNSFKNVSRLVQSYYKADVCVLQCGADVLVGDPLGGANLVLEDLGQCLKEVLSWNIPLMLLGGGGYNSANAARVWTYLTSLVCRKTLTEDIPDNDFFLKYSPDYEMKIEPKPMKDLNLQDDLNRNYRVIKENLLKHKVSNV